MTDLVERLRDPKWAADRIEFLECRIEAADEIERLQRFILEGHCPDAAGFEGPDTFPDCGQCVYCGLVRAKQALSAQE